ncbi:MAG: hypothetical protein LBC19_08700 [Tannerella sp.]|nr:hypothetical protein [Tannerella sp.]
MKNLIQNKVSVNVQVLRYRPGVRSATRLATRTLSGEPVTIAVIRYATMWTTSVMNIT